jgi:hypothetical protein
MSTSLVITSIASPNDVLKACAEGARKNNVDFIVIGDTKSPDNFKLDNCSFYSVDAQEKLNMRLAKELPKRHYSRKNIGYILSKHQDVIIETDDDNYPYDEFWKPRKMNIHAGSITEEGWCNVYKYFSEENIWPRGYPIELLPGSQEILIEGEGEFNCPIQQGLADDNPDVDAIYRMTLKLPITFKKRNSVALGKNCWCPFNSQNTSWFKKSFLLLYLPSYCSFRMTDIWRSFIAQRIAWTCDWSVLFHHSTVRQDRNDHNLLRDFEEEIPGYLNNQKICDLLEKLDLKSGENNIAENLLRCYRALVEARYIPETELPLVESWIYDMT